MRQMLTMNLAVVSLVEGHDPSDVARVAAALQRQATRDFAPVWDVSATVDAFPTLDDVPVGYWPVIVEVNIDTEGAAGVHEDKDGQPFALVQMSNSWSLTASHEMLEMLADPFGRRLIAAPSPDPRQGRVEILVEVADPCEADQFAYTVNDVLVSDFYTPHFFDPVAAPGVRYDFTGAITEPRQVLRGGYVSWHDPVSDQWFQETWFTGNKPTFRELRPDPARTGSIRSWVDAHTDHPGIEAGLSVDSRPLQAAVARGAATAASSSARAAALRAQIQSMVRGDR
jgi:hypothetical protein